MGTEFNYAVSVGAMLADDLRNMHITQTELASRIGVSKSVISEIISGKRKMSQAVALALEPVLGVDADYWLTLQSRYDLMQKKEGSYLIGGFAVIKTAENSAEQIASWFINRAAKDAEEEKGEYMTNLKLQKMLYLAQKTSLKKESKALFPEEMRHWKFGPVVTEIYEKYKGCGAGPLKREEEINLGEAIESLLESVYEKYNMYSAAGLVTITHNDRAWKESEDAEVITPESILRS